MEDRKNPDQILKEINKEAQKAGRGRLKIFFGYAAGVGKTCAMLDAARSDLKNGMDVLAGYIEPHARPDTIELLSGLEVLSPLKLKYKGIELLEFDLDAALFRKPQLILVDELAHTNAFGCRHAKRYQDIRELLEAGIDVYTTVNVQHLESLNDIVASITQVEVKERIPDSIFDEADQVELVDIEPEQLIRRLEQGKIYGREQAGRAAGNFFIKENLTALREIALRRTADRVNRKVMEERSAKEGADYYTGEHILTCISPSPANGKVIRTAARMAGAFKAELTALYVETPEFEEADKKLKQAVYDHIKLAKQFGARAAVIYGENVAYQIAEYAKANGISKIVIGRSANAGNHFVFWKSNLIEKLTSLAPNLDIYVIPDKIARYQKNNERKTWQPSLKGAAKMAVVLAGCTALGEIIYMLKLGNIGISALYIAGTVLTAWITGGRIWTAGAAVLGVAFYNLFFTEPRFTLLAYGSIYPFTFVIMLLVSLITGELTFRLKKQGRQEFLKSRRTEILLGTSQKLRRAIGVREIIKEGAVQVMDLLGCSVAVYETLGGPPGIPVLYHPKDLAEESRKETDARMSSDDEGAVAAWVYKTGHRAGRTTDTLPSAFAYYLPLAGEKGIFAIYGLILGEGEEINPFDKNILKAMMNETAFATEKYVLLNEQKKLMMDAEKDKLRSGLLRAVSHDLRTPLTAITGSSSTLLEEGEKLEEEQKQEIYKNLYSESLWLGSMVENILTVTRLSGNEESIKTETHYLCDIIQDALRHIGGFQRDHPVEVRLPEPYVVKGDAHLISRVLMNLVDNSMRYTQQDSLIIISARRDGTEITVEVADNGPGISDEEKSRILDLHFRRAGNHGDSRRGLGLGLSLCKTILDAHGGKIYVRDNDPKGAVFGFTLKEGKFLCKPS